MDTLSANLMRDQAGDYGPQPTGSVPVNNSQIVLAMDCVLMPHDLDDCRGPSLTTANSSI